MACHHCGHRVIMATKIKNNFTFKSGVCEHCRSVIAYTKAIEPGG